MTALNRISNLVSVLGITMGLGSCASMSALTGPGQEFVSAANTLAQAESDYFDEIQAASDAAYRMQAAETYVAGKRKFTEFAGELAHRDDFSKAKAMRVGVMKQLQNYAQQIAAILSGASATWIAESAKTDVTDVSGLVKDAGAEAASQLLTKNSGAIETAVTKLGSAIVANQSAKELRTLATAARDPIATIANMIDQDNKNIEDDTFTQSLKADQTQALMDILHLIYDDPKVSALGRFEAIQATANWKPILVTKGIAIASALKALQSANDAMAKGDVTSLSGLAQQIYAEAKQSLDTPKPNTSTTGK